MKRGNSLGSETIAGASAADHLAIVPLSGGDGACCGAEPDGPREGSIGRNMTELGVEAILDRIHDPVLIVDNAQRVVLANRAASDLLGDDPQDQLEGRHLLALIRQPEILAGVGEVLNGAAARMVRHVSRRAVEAVYRVEILRLNADDDGVEGAMLIFDDRTAIEKAEQLRSDFVANVSHELRSPLTSLTGFIETLQGPAAEDAAARAAFLQTMRDEAERMRRLIEDLLSLSRVEATERLRPRERIDLIALIRGVLRTFAPEAEKAGVAIALESAEKDLIVPGDRDQLIQVFRNLIENALKYGGGKDVRITITRQARHAGMRGPLVRVDVIDQGPGIAGVHLPRLTERFYRIDTHRARDVGGTGLGLAIVKHIALRHRGSLKIRSHPGEGSVFSVILPLE